MNEKLLLAHLIKAVEEIEGEESDYYHRPDVLMAEVLNTMNRIFRTALQEITDREK